MSSRHISRIYENLQCIVSLSAVYHVWGVRRNSRGIGYEYHSYVVDRTYLREAIFSNVQCNFIMTLTPLWWLCVSKYRLLHSYGIHGQCLLSSFRHHTHGTQQTYWLYIGDFQTFSWKYANLTEKIMFPSNFMQKRSDKTLRFFENYRFMEIEQFMSRFPSLECRWWMISWVEA